MLLMMGEENETIEYVHGPATLKHCTGKKTMNRNRFNVPVIIVTHNKYMNGVYKADQMRMVLPSKRKEKRLYMNMFTYFLDLGLLNAFTSY